jgi:uncharacterized FlaG/YvyC family protein
MYIKKIRFTYLRNEAHYEFLVVVLNLLLKFPRVQNVVKPFYQPLIELVELEKHLVDAARKSIYTQKIADMDERIDRDIAGIKAAIVSARHHFDPDVEEAAQNLYYRMKNFGNIKGKPYEEESAAVQLLISDLRGTFAPQVTILNLNKWVDELEFAENEFTQLFERRITELADRPKERIKEVRRDIENLYRKITSCIDTDFIINGEQDCGEFIKQLNEDVKYFNEHIYHQTKKDISKAIIVPIADQAYTGEQVIVIPTVVYEDSSLTPPVKKTLILATDYTLSYNNNIQPGNASLTVHGKGAYKGQKTVTFSIS